mmetsp:Transcript_6474/g.13442  ORF Transcript_6474/g.13442 Transcript_6474/m.13442 type:complete len:90 (-) Transcript_6474:77-346(-)
MNPFSFLLSVDQRSRISSSSRWLYMKSISKAVLQDIQLTFNYYQDRAPWNISILEKDTFLFNITLAHAVECRDDGVWRGRKAGLSTHDV